MSPLGNWASGRGGAGAGGCAPTSRPNLGAGREAGLRDARGRRPGTLGGIVGGHFSEPARQPGTRGRGRRGLRPYITAEPGGRARGRDAGQRRRRPFYNQAFTSAFMVLRSVCAVAPVIDRHLPTSAPLQTDCSVSGVLASPLPACVQNGQTVLPLQS